MYRNKIGDGFIKYVEVGDILEINWNTVFRDGRVCHDNLYNGKYVVESTTDVCGYRSIRSDNCPLCRGKIKLSGEETRCFGYSGGFPFKTLQKNTISISKLFDDLIEEV